MNATLQCLRAIPELQSSLSHITTPLAATSHDPRSGLPISLKALFQELGSAGDSVMPVVFLQLLQTAFPQFGEMSRSGGGFMQQDAEECWMAIVGCLKELVPGLTMEGQTLPDKRFVDQYMSGTISSVMKCDEAPEEPTSTHNEPFNKLAVNISAGSATYLATEIANSLIQTLEKNSPTLNRTAHYTKNGKFSRLPSYLTVNFIRFQWKATEKLRAKILKKVKFPFELDLTTYCTPELIEMMRPAKERLLKIEDIKKEEEVRLLLLLYSYFI